MIRVVVLIEEGDQDAMVIVTRVRSALCEAVPEETWRMTAYRHPGELTAYGEPDSPLPGDDAV